MNIATTEHVVDARAFEPRPPAPSGCRRCGGEIPSREPTRQRYCSSRCSKTAYGRRREGEAVPETPGTCPICGARFEPEDAAPAFCSKRCRIRWNRERRPWVAFLSLVKRPHGLDWLAAKLGLEPEDPRLPELALRLAEAGKLVVYVRRDGDVGEVGWPRKEAS